MNYEELKKKFEENQDPKRAAQMKRYMRNKFDFYGYQSVARKAVYHQDLLLEKRHHTIDWQLLKQAWQDSHREMQYFACDYLIALEKYLQFEDLDKIRQFVEEKSWWDTIDSLIKPIGKLGLQDSRVDKVMLEWSRDSNFWLRRVAIEHQLLRKENMNVKLLNTILENNLGQEEFFINKAIGWALRDYSKTDPTWVQNFIQIHQDELAPLSIKEGSKYL